MDSANKKQIINAYKAKQTVGGIYCLSCSGNSRKLIMSSTDLESAKSRFIFAVQIKSCPDPRLREEWLKFGVESFSFEVLEELKKNDTQTAQEFSADIKALYEMWLQKAESGEGK